MLRLDPQAQGEEAREGGQGPRRRLPAKAWGSCRRARADVPRRAGRRRGCDTTGAQETACPGKTGTFTVGKGAEISPGWKGHRTVLRDGCLDPDNPAAA